MGPFERILALAAQEEAQSSSSEAERREHDSSGHGSDSDDVEAVSSEQTQRAAPGPAGPVRLREHEGIVIGQRELAEQMRGFQAQLHKCLAVHDFEEAEEVRKAAHGFMADYIRSCKESSKACAAGKAFEQASELKKAVAKASGLYRTLKGSSSEQLVLRMEELLAEYQSQVERLRLTIRKAANAQKFPEAQAAQRKLDELGILYRKRLCVAYSHAIEDRTVGTMSISVFRAAWDRVEICAPDRTPDIPPPRRRPPPREKKLSKEQVNALADRLSKQKKKRAGGNMLYDDETNCTFQPDPTTARVAFEASEAGHKHWRAPTGNTVKAAGNADPEGLKHRKEEVQLEAIRRTILPSVKKKLGDDFLTAKNSEDDVMKLLGMSQQVQYWDLTESESLKLTMSTNKAAELSTLLAVKAFMHRNCTSSG